MSFFGQYMDIANQIVDAEFEDVFAYQPMREVINAEPAPDASRSAGLVTAILLQPGMTLGSSHSLHAMHERATSQPTLWFMARGLLVDVRRFDRFALTDASTNPDLVPRRYEIADGPKPYGFGRYSASLVEIPPTDDGPVVDIDPPF
jgi:hypothetical protein